MTAASEIIPPASTDVPREGVATRHRIFDRLLVALFIMAIGIPLLGTWGHWDVGQKFNEKRQLAALPAWPKNYRQAKTFVPRFLSYYRDHFGFRNLLIQGQMEAQVEVSGVSPNPMVALGTQGWIYWCPPSDADYAKYRGLAPLSDSELDAWQKMFEGRQAVLATRHIPYLVVFTPDKQTIYPEFMPESTRKVRNISRLDQLMDRLETTKSSVRILDLRQEMFRAKSVEQLYYRGDTHWNQFGAYVGYRAIMAEIKRMLPDKHLVILGPDDFQRFPEQRIGGDLPDVLGVPERYKEQLMSMTPRVPVPVPVAPHDGYIPEIVLDNADQQLPRLVMFRDSFATALIPLMARSFSHGVYLWGYFFPTDTIDAQKPDLVISQFIERELDEPPPHTLQY